MGDKSARDGRYFNAGMGRGYETLKVPREITDLLVVDLYDHWNTYSLIINPKEINRNTPI